MGYITVQNYLLDPLGNKKKRIFIRTMTQLSDSGLETSATWLATQVRTPRDSDLGPNDSRTALPVSHNTAPYDSPTFFSNQNPKHVLVTNA